MSQDDKSHAPNADELFQQVMRSRDQRKKSDEHGSGPRSQLVATDNAAGESELEERARPVGLSKDTAGAGLINRFRAEKLRVKKQLEALTIHWDGQIEKLKTETEAGVREAKTFWDAKSVEVAERIKTYVQGAIDDLENERLTSKSEAIIRARQSTHDQVQKIIASNMTDSVKSQCIIDVMQNCADTVERIMSNAIAEKYSLT